MPIISLFGKILVDNICFQNEVVKLLITQYLFFYYSFESSKKIVIHSLMVGAVYTVVHYFLIDNTLIQIPFILLIIYFFKRGERISHIIESIIIIAFLDDVLLNIFVYSLGVSKSVGKNAGSFISINFAITIVFIGLLFLKRLNIWRVDFTKIGTVPNILLVLALLLLDCLETIVSDGLVELFFSNYVRVGNIVINIIFLVFFFAFVLLVNSINHIQVLNLEIHDREQMLERQSEFYRTLLAKDEHTRRIRHDMKAHLMLIKELVENEDYNELKDYLDSMEQDVRRCFFDVKTGNHMIDFIICDLKRNYQGIDIVWKGKIPNELNIRNYDLCTIFYNILRNACQAVKKNKNKIINVQASVNGSALIIEIKNLSHDSIVIDKEYNIIKQYSKGHGYGLQNVKRSVGRYDGLYEVTFENNEYITNIILPKAIGDDIQVV